MGKFNLLENIKEKFSKYKPYHEILGINLDLTNDEEVKNAYDNKCMQLNMMLKDYEGEGIQEIRELIQMTLDDAYMALKTENARKNYKELLLEINNKNKSKEEYDESER
jgi:preprotein translocase subunit Sec63